MRRFKSTRFIVSVIACNYVRRILKLYIHSQNILLCILNRLLSMTSNIKIIINIDRIFLFYIKKIVNILFLTWLKLQKYCKILMRKSKKCVQNYLLTPRLHMYVINIILNTWKMTHLSCPIIVRRVSCTVQRVSVSKWLHETIELCSESVFKVHGSRSSSVHGVPFAFPPLGPPVFEPYL